MSTLTVETVPLQPGLVRVSRDDVTAWLSRADLGAALTRVRKSRTGTVTVRGLTLDESDITSILRGMQ